jgi:lysophospholipase L1-like esterase
MRWFQWLCAALLWLPAACPQQRGLLSNKEASELFGRAVQLMESTSVAIPELARAGAPLVENARQALITMRATPGQNAGLTYTYLTNLRAFLFLSDSVPQPFPLPDEPRKQFSELRAGLNRVEAHFRALLEQKEAQLRNPDRDNLGRYAEANARLGLPQPGRPRVVFLGDSITDGWRLNEYFPERDFVNRGISGQITGEMLGRMKADVIDVRPAMVLVLAGTNDIALGVPVRTIQNNLTMIADLAEAHKIRPLFASLLPVSDYHKDQNPQFEQSQRRPPATIREINTWLANFCRQRNYAYVDYFSETADRSGFLKANLSDDGLHPNSAGYRILAPVALAAIDKAAGLPPAQPKKRRLGVF